jgi:hypothetical protein
MPRRIKENTSSLRESLTDLKWDTPPWLEFRLCWRICSLQPNKEIQSCSRPELVHSNLVKACGKGAAIGKPGESYHLHPLTQCADEPQSWEKEQKPPISGQRPSYFIVPLAPSTDKTLTFPLGKGEHLQNSPPLSQSKVFNGRFEAEDTQIGVKEVCNWCSLFPWPPRYEWF